MLLTRQGVPILVGSDSADVARGGYVIADMEDPEAILIASGSEVAVVWEAKELLKAEGIAVRVVSIPSWELFEVQPQEYRDAVLPPEVTARVAVEAGVPLGWERYVGSQGTILALNRFGASAPYTVIADEFGFTAQAVVARVRHLLQRPQ
jgi:transketolase